MMLDVIDFPFPTLSNLPTIRLLHYSSVVKIDFQIRKQSLKTENYYICTLQHYYT